jgi:ribosomal protein S4
MAGNQSEKLVSMPNSCTKNKRSSVVKPGEEIEMKGSAVGIPDVQELTETGKPVPGRLERRDGEVPVLREPNREEFDPDIQERRIVEFYSG